MLPDGIVKNMYMKTISHYWSAGISMIGGGGQMKLFKIVGGLAGEFVRLQDFNNWEQIGEDPRELVIHEVMHEYATAESYIFPRFPIIPVVSDVANLLIYGVTRLPKYGIASAPLSYIEAVGCSRKKLFSGLYTYSTNPVTGYSDIPEETECGEDFADSAGWYVTKPCDLLNGGVTSDKKAGEVRY